MAAASMNRAGNVSDMAARAMETLPSSDGCQCSNPFPATKAENRLTGQLVIWMSVHLQARIWRTIDVRGTEMLLLIAYADIADDDGNSIFASDEHMSWKTSIPMRTLRRIKQRWRTSGVLLPVGRVNLTTKERILTPLEVHRGICGRGWVLLYRLCLEPLPKKKPWDEVRGRKAATVATFSGEGCNGRTKRLQSRSEKVANCVQEDCQILKPNKEEPSGEPSAEPSGKRQVQNSRPYLTIAKGKFWKIYHSLPVNRERNVDADKMDRLKIAAVEAGLTLAESKSMLQEHPQWKTWSYLKDLDVESTMVFPPDPDPDTVDWPGLPHDLANSRLAADIWRDTLAVLRGKMSEHSWGTWLKPTHGVGIRGDVLYVKVPTQEFLHIEGKFGDLIRKELPQPIKAVRSVLMRTNKAK